MKKTVLLFTMICLAFSQTYAQVFPTTSWENFADNSWYNTEDDTFELATAEELAGLAKMVSQGNSFANKTILINQDINLDGNLWQPIGKNISLPFSGELNGQNYKISNIWVNQPNLNFGGFFGQVYDGSIKNLTINNVTVRASDTSGALAGQISTNSIIEKCHALNVDIKSVGDGYNTGGFVGAAITNSTITQSNVTGLVEGKGQIGGFIGSPWNNVTITECYAETTVIGDFFIGGFVGFSTFSMGSQSFILIKDCYAISNVTAIQGGAGGFYGAVQLGTVENCFAASTVNTSGNKGGFIGEGQGFTATNCYFDTTVVGEGVNAIGGATQVNEIEGKPTLNMKTTNFKVLLDNERINSPWAFVMNSNEESNYPYLAAVPLTNKTNINYEKLNFFPNPINDLLNITSKQMIESISIFNTTGKEVFKCIVNQNKSINVSELPSGTYIIKAKDSNQQVYINKLIKK